MSKLIYQAASVRNKLVETIGLSNEDRQSFDLVFNEALEAYAERLESLAPAAKFETGERVMVNANKRDTWMGCMKEQMDELKAAYGTEFVVKDAFYDVDDLFDHPKLEGLQQGLESTYSEFRNDAELLFKMHEQMDAFFRLNKFDKGWLYELSDTTRKATMPADTFFPEEALIAEKSKAGHIYKRLCSALYEERLLTERLSEKTKDSERIGKLLAAELA